MFLLSSFAKAGLNRPAFHFFSANPGVVGLHTIVVEKIGQDNQDFKSHNPVNLVNSVDFFGDFLAISTVVVSYHSPGMPFSSWMVAVTWP